VYLMPVGLFQAPRLPLTGCTLSHEHPVCSVPRRGDAAAGRIGIIAGRMEDEGRETGCLDAMNCFSVRRWFYIFQEHYDKLRQSGKALLPHAKVFFLAPAEE
jgi:hypothetical protein